MAVAFGPEIFVHREKITCQQSILGKDFPMQMAALSFEGEAAAIQEEEMLSVPLEMPLVVPPATLALDVNDEF
ncbi:hypothetical protein AMTR_s00013p00259760 [Amborella trichopoda]|uniref:Uncharacterized protein n=1 Tax=Amborella trichopoda TaxID=13333 RepID=W1PJB5_AMBTC|nr:hypothetical protein AMTR_s00013p00259760 [Amborella trichopoda]